MQSEDGAEPGNGRGTATVWQLSVQAREYPIKF